MGVIQTGYLTQALKQDAGFYSNNELLNTLGSFWSIGMIHRKYGISIGGSYTFAGALLATAITGDNIVSALKDANKAGLGLFIADADVKMPMGDTKQEGIVLAAYAAAKSTNITHVKADAQLRHSENSGFRNYLRGNPEDDLFFFTNTGLVHFPFAEMPLSYSAIGTERNSGDTTTAGGLKFSVTGKSFTGEPSLILADTSDSKTFATYDLVRGVMTNATLSGVKGDISVIKRTASALLEIPVTVTNYLVDWRIRDYVTNIDISGTNITFDAVNSKLVILAGTPIGVYKVKVIAFNAKGVTGESLMEITLV